ncbi:carboxymuconolactone decarboxylase family protein [Rhodobacter maris]|uniref:AhpD family alkylhydroperoxidase n=1 Tax=Rhodobacter maris TaxID=446682 RepID=A0A285RJU2_9RHOB|nr:carboxymuconolactone decarboxylase family protein [Rhodobacter maris]SOB94134.1 AhpD family alkylhydroperoxidase [Rhodobacter maris]
MSYKQKMEDQRAELRVMSKAIPDAMRGFGAMEKAITENGVLDKKQKEWLAVAMGIVIRCEPCVNFHVSALMRAGGTREELSDICAVAIQMGGGPAMMYAAHALACWDEIAAEAPQG